MTRSGLAQRVIDLPNIGESLESAQWYRANRDKAYKEGFEEFVSMAEPYEINGKRYLAHPNINLYVDFTAACNCDCEFCIAKVNFARQCGQEMLVPSRLNKALILLKEAGIKHTIQITGGEPTLWPIKLSHTLAVIEKHNVPNPVLNTNGFASIPQKHVLSHINVSRHHYNDVTNARIMRSSSIPSSRTLALILPGIGRDKVRLQCNMIGDEIDTYGEVMQFIAYAYHKLGITNLVFAQLTPLPRNSFYDPDIIDYVSDHQVDVDVILARIEKDSRFAFEKYRGGVACYYEVWKFTAYEAPMTIIFKYSDNKWLEKADEDLELLPDLVLHTDGTLSGSWCKDRKVIAKF